MNNIHAIYGGHSINKVNFVQVASNKKYSL